MEQAMILFNSAPFQDGTSLKEKNLVAPRGSKFFPLQISSF